MAEKADFRTQQYAFAAHLRDPDRSPAPAGIEDRRLAIYRDLFFNNVSKLLAGTFPVLNKILSDDHWRSLIRDFFIRHESKTPLFLEVPREFLAYLQKEREAQPEDPPFLTELAHYEWVELALSVEDIEPDLSDVDRSGDLLEGIPVLSPLAWPLAYRFPVHRISPDFQPDEAPDDLTFLVVYRDSADKVGFLKINAVSARLIELMQEGSTRTGRELLEIIATELNHPNTDTVISGGHEIMEELRSHDIILGTKIASCS